MAAAALGGVILLLAAACGASETITPASPASRSATEGANTGSGDSPSATPAPTRTTTLIPTPTPAIPPTVVCDWAEVTGVDDGDTFRIRTVSGGEDRVRLIGIDAPEGGKPLSVEATTSLTESLGTRVCLEKDTTDRDRFGRLLRYGWTESGVLVNEALVLLGLATVVTFPPDVRHLADRYEPAEVQAKAARLGLWALTATSTPTTAGVAEPLASPPPAAGGDCDPAYPDVCIAPVASVGDLDCGDIPYRRFRVLPPDPHRFDADKNGLGCESG
ncbi:MAG: thermonuclease family protein [Dehalococcoidia bacterium]